MMCLCAHQSSLCNAYAKCERMEKALEVFEGMPKRDLFSWSTVTMRLASVGKPEEAIGVYRMMWLDSVDGDETVLVGMAQVCAGIAKNGLLELSCVVFDRMPVKNLVPWTIIIAGYAKKGPAKEASCILDQTEEAGFEPNESVILQSMVGTPCHCDSMMGSLAWVSVELFAAVDAACFQGFLAEGLQRRSAGLGSVIIDSQPLTVSILAALLFGESIGAIGAAGLVLGVVGLLLLEVPALSFEGSDSTIWGSGEWWMLLAAQSMAIGTVMVRWVSKYSDPVMATGWHMVIGGIPLLVISFLNNDPAISGSLKDLTSNDLLALLYTSIFGSAISYGVYFYNATRGSLTKLSSLTFLTPMFASIFGFLYLGETFSPLQLVGAFVTVVAIYMVNYRDIVNEA